MVRNEVFIAGQRVEEQKFVVQEEEVDKRIEIIVRTIQQQVLKFYQEYRSLHDIVQNSTNVREELNKLTVCKTQLDTIHGLCVSELNSFIKMEKDFQGKTRNIYLQVLTDLKDMINELNAYIGSLDFILKILHKNQYALSDEKVKEGFKNGFNILHSKYNAFIKSDENLIELLNNIKNIPWK